MIIYVFIYVFIHLQINISKDSWSLKSFLDKLSVLTLQEGFEVYSFIAMQGYQLQHKFSRIIQV